MERYTENSGKLNGIFKHRLHAIYMDVKFILNNKWIFVFLSFLYVRLSESILKEEST